jgi:hypothetical protein
MDQHVGRYFAENGSPQTSALNAFQIKWVRQMLLEKSLNAVNLSLQT